MRDPARQKLVTGELATAFIEQNGIRKNATLIEEPRCMIQRHKHHDNTAHPVYGGNALKTFIHRIIHLAVMYYLQIPKNKKFLQLLKQGEVIAMNQFSFVDITQ